MNIFRSDPGPQTEYNPDKIDELNDLLFKDEPIPPLVGKPKELTREDVLDILKLEYPDTFKDIHQRIRKREMEIADFEMYSNLITDHNSDFHRKTMDRVKTLISNADD